MAHHPLVVDLVRLVGRLFYRDEYTVVLDALTREHALRDDGLEDYFGLPDRQIRRILIDLLNEKLVCFEEITERRERKRDQKFDWDKAEAVLLSSNGTAQAAAAAANRRGQKDDDSDDESDEEDGGGGAAGADGKSKAVREKRKISTRLWHLNPRYFVDVIRYRLHLMRRSLQRLEGYAGGSEHMFNCGNRFCTYECTLLEAQQRRTAEIAATARAGGMGMGAIGSVQTPLFMGAGSGGGAQAGGASSSSGGPSYFSGFSCPLCGSGLTARHTENVATAAAKLLVKLDDQLRWSGLAELMKRLEGVRLGA